MMNSFPNFEMKNHREYPTYVGAPIPKANVSTARRIVQCFSLKVFFWGTWTIWAIVAFFEKPFASSLNANLPGDWLFFAGGLILGLFVSFLLQKLVATHLTLLWQRLLLLIVNLVFFFLLVYHYAATNNFFFSLINGAAISIFAWFAIAVYRSNWATYS